MKHIIRAVKEPTWALGVLLRAVSPVIKSDRAYLKIEYFLGRKRILHLDPPIRFNEKLQWLKLNCKREEYTERVDKYEAKKFVASKIGEQYIIPNLGVWEHFNDIDFDKLPNQFVLKCTHDSAGLIICQDKKSFDVEAARKKINRSLKKRYFYEHREYPYKNVKPRIIAENYMVDESGWQLKDYKIFCFNGEPRFIEVDYDRYVGHKLNVYDLNWNFMDFYMTSPNDINTKIEKPVQLEKMLDLARKLSEGDIFVRVDLYSIGDKIFFGELTYHPGCGMIDFQPDEWDYKLGEWLKLPQE